MGGSLITIALIGLTSLIAGLVVLIVVEGEGSVVGGVAEVLCGVESVVDGTVVGGVDGVVGCVDCVFGNCVVKVGVAVLVVEVGVSVVEVGVSVLCVTTCESGSSSKACMCGCGRRTSISDCGLADCVEEEVGVAEYVVGALVDHLSAINGATIVRRGVVSSVTCVTSAACVTFSGMSEVGVSVVVMGVLAGGLVSILAISDSTMSTFFLQGA